MGGEFRKEGAWLTERRPGGHITVCSKLHAKAKLQRIQQLSQTEVFGRFEARTWNLGFSVAKPSFKTRPKGKLSAHAILAGSFEQTVT